MEIILKDRKNTEKPKQSNIVGTIRKQRAHFKTKTKHIFGGNRNFINNKKN